MMADAASDDRCHLRWTGASVPAERIRDVRVGDGRHGPAAASVADPHSPRVLL
jgi:hypothetical protein